MWMIDPWYPYCLFLQDGQEASVPVGEATLSLHK